MPWRDQNWGHSRARDLQLPDPALSPKLGRGVGNREIHREFRPFRPVRTIFAFNRRANSSVYRRIPYSMEAGNNRVKQIQTLFLPLSMWTRRGGVVLATVAEFPDGRVLPPREMALPVECLRAVT